MNKINIKINKKTFKHGAFTTLITVLFLAAVILINVIVSALGDRVNLKFDLTPNSKYDVSKETQDYLKGLTKNIEINTMMTESDMVSVGNYYGIDLKQVVEIIKKYKMYSDKVSLNFLDMLKNPDVVSKFKENYKGDITQYDLVVSCGDRVQVIPLTDLFIIDTDYNTYTQTITGYNADAKLTSAIMYVTDANPKKAAFVSGSSQSVASSAALSAMLSSNGYDVSEISLPSSGISSDIDLIIVNSPANDFTANECSALSDFLYNEGKLNKNMIYIANVGQKITPNLDTLLEEWGMKVGDGYVLESDKNLIGYVEYNPGVLCKATDETYTQGLANPSLSILAPFSRPIEVLFETKGDRNALSILKTSSTAYVMPEEEDENFNISNVKKGEQNLMAVGTKFKFEDNKQIKSTMLVLGSGYMLDSALTQSPSLNNGDYTINVINKILGKEDQGITILEKDVADTKMTVTEKQAGNIRTVIVYVIPFAVVAVGIFIWVRRRYR